MLLIRTRRPPRSTRTDTLLPYTACFRSVRVKKGRRAADYRLELGDTVRVPPLRLPRPDEPRRVPPAVFPVVFEDEAMVVVNKPAGVAVHGGSGVSFASSSNCALRVLTPPFWSSPTGWTVKPPAC